MRRSFAWLGLLATLALLVAACGDDTLSDEAYYAALADVGADSDARGDALFATFATEAGDALVDTEAATTFLDGFQAIFVDARAVVATLAAPRDLASAHDAFVEALDTVIDELEEGRAQVAAGADIVAIFLDLQLAAFDELERVCDRLERLGRDRDIHVTLSCADE